jgi:type VI secretion system protein ImpG
MTQHDDLYGHYERELLYLRRAGAGFARTYPKVAGRLALGPEKAGDPHVERLLESFAFLTARLQLDLERQYPKLTDALLGVLYPHLVSPVPSCGIARFSADADSGQLTDGYVQPRGTELSAVAPGDLRCRFTTTQPVELWPVEIERTAGLAVDHAALGDDTVAVLGIDLVASGVTFDELPIKRLRVFINAEPTVAAAVYEALTCDHNEAVFLSGDGTVRHVVRKPVARAAAFDPADALLPGPGNTHPAYRLLQEYFAFPQKFLFVDIDIPPGALAGERGTLLLGLRRVLPARMHIRPDTLLLGCTPVVNLFRKFCEPVRVDQQRSSYFVQPDALRDRITEVYSIETVSGIRADGRRIDYARLYSIDHASARLDGDAFWFATREPSLDPDRPGNDFWLSLLDRNLDVAEPASETLLVGALCTNRGLAEDIPANARLELEAAAPVASVAMLYKPTMPRYRSLAGESAWKLVSQLSLNHLSLSMGDGALKALHELLGLHAMDDPVARTQIAALKGLTTRSVVHLMGHDAWRGFCRGLEVTIEIDERGFVGASPLIFGEVLARFLGLYTSYNTFTQLRFASQQRGGHVFKTWPRIAGDCIVL